MIKRRIGIIGGGQLGKMLAQEAKRMGFWVGVIDPTENSPAGQVCDKQIVADFGDKKAIMQLADEVDYLTFEIELADSEVLKEIADRGVLVNPSGKSLEIIRDKYGQKKFYSEHGLPVAPFVQVDSVVKVRNYGKEWGFPFVLKSRFGAYDGRGNATIVKPADIEYHWKRLGEKNLYIEEFVDFEMELAVMVARSMQGEISVYPVVETVHQDHILSVVKAPAQVDSEIVELAQSVAISAVEQFEGAGVFGVELFLTKSGDILINEVAPRVHNSGHYTIEACVTSQFEQHIRAITGMSLGSSEMKVPAAVMVNVLGKTRREFTLERMDSLFDLAGASVHLYNKKIEKPQRKMGHVTVVGDDVDELYEEVSTIIDGGGVIAKELMVSSSVSSQVKVGVVMGSDSDLGVMKEACKVLEKFGIGYYLSIVSAHRTPDRLVSFAKKAYEQGLRVIIAGAGGAAHLPGMISAHTSLPVIGVPIMSRSLNGVDSLYSIVQMPPGVPTACVAINGAVNAGLLAVQILGVGDPVIMAKMIDYKQLLGESVEKKARDLEVLGWQGYENL